MGFDCLSTVKLNDANATDGAAPNNPANVFGLKMSEISENSETTKPPIMNLITRSCKSSTSKMRNSYADFARLILASSSREASFCPFTPKTLNFSPLCL